MSKINGDKARQNVRDRKQAKMRARNQALKATLKPVKAAATTETAKAAAPAK